MTRSRPALRAGAFVLLAQFCLQAAWHGALAPASRAALALAVLPLLPPLWLCLYDLARGVLVGAIVGLFYFCHGVAELMGARTAAWLPALEVALSLGVVAALYLDMRAAKQSMR